MEPLLSVKHGESCTRGEFSVQEKKKIRSFLDETSFYSITGATLQNLAFPENILCVYIREHYCSDTMRKKTTLLVMNQITHVQMKC